jgi:hypothetical protein
VLVVVIAFLSLGKPTYRDTADTILVWLMLRFTIGALILLALWWAWEFARPPKVKRRQIKKHRPGKHRPKSPVSHVRTTPQITTSGDALSVDAISPGVVTGADDTPPEGIPMTRDALIRAKMSGASPLWHTEDE